jgi:hypothetical protein
LARSRIGAAQQRLQRALPVFTRYGDARAVAATEDLLGDTAVAAHAFDGAVEHYAACVQSSLSVNDLLTATHAWNNLVRLDRRFHLGSQSRSRISALEQSFDRRAYIARFPGNLLRNFRRLSAYVAIPLAFFLGILMFILFTGFVSIEELIIRSLGIARFTTARDILTAGAVALSVFLLVLWLYELVYLVIGWCLIRRPDLESLTRHQPEYLVTLPDRIALLDRQGRTQTVLWSEVERYVTIDRSWWRSPSELFSRHILAGKAQTLLIEGIFSDFWTLRHDITRHLSGVGNTKAIQLDFSFLRNRWTLMALLLSALMVPISTFQSLETTCRQAKIFRASINDEPTYVFVTSPSEGLRVVVAEGAADEENRFAMREVAFAHVRGDASDVAVYGTRVYVASDATGLLIYDVADPGQPRVVSHIAIQGRTTAVAVSGDWAAVALGERGVSLIDVSSPNAASTVSSFDTPGEAHGLAIAGRYLYVADGTAGVEIVDIANPNSPSRIGSVHTPGQALRVSIAGSLLLVADGTAGVQVIDVTSPNRPVAVGGYDTPGEAMDVATDDSLIFVADGTGGLRVLHMEHPGSLKDVKAASMPGGSRAVDVTLSVDVAYVAEDGGFIHAYNALDPCEPKGLAHLSQLTLAHGANSVATRQPILLPVTTMVYWFSYWAFCFVPIFGLVRLLNNRYRARRVGDARPPLTIGALWLALFLLLALTAFLLYLQTT